MSEPPVLPVGWDEGRLRPASDERPLARDLGPDADRDDEREREAERDPEPEPSDPGGRQAAEESSDAIARLRREVRNWKR